MYSSFCTSEISNQSINQTTNQSIKQPTNQSITRVIANVVEIELTLARVGHRIEVDRDRVLVRYSLVNLEDSKLLIRYAFTHGGLADRPHVVNTHGSSRISLARSRMATYDVFRLGVADEIEASLGLVEYLLLKTSAGDVVVVELGRTR